MFPRTTAASDALNFSKLLPNMDVYSKPTVNTHNRAPGAKAPNRGAIPPLASSLPPALLSPSVPGPKQAGGGGRGGDGVVLGEGEWMEWEGGAGSELEQVYLLEQARPRQPPRGLLLAAPAFFGPPSPLPLPPPLPLLAPSPLPTFPPSSSPLSHPPSRCR